MESVVVALIPVVPAVVPPLSSFRGRAGATGGDGLSHASRHRACRVARVPRRRGRVPCGETEGEVGGTPGMPAGQTGGAGMVGGACPDHARVRLRIAPRRGAGDVVGGSGAWARPCRAGAPGGGGQNSLAGGDRTTWAGGHHAGAVGLSESATGEARPAAAATGPSRQCRPLKLMTLPSAPGTSRASCAAPSRMPRGPRSFPGAA